MTFVHGGLWGKIPRGILLVFCLSWLPFKGLAIIDAALQMQLGNPTGATMDPNNHTNYLIVRTVEAIGYNDNMGQANWASWDLTASDVGSSGRSDAWATDTSLPASFKVIPTSTYGSVNGQSYDRGHLCPSADRTDTLANNELVFIMSNIMPQASAQNQGNWATLESYCRTLLSSQELLITCGPYNFGPSTVDSGKVNIASNTFKVIVCVPLGAGTAFSRITNADPATIRVIAVEIPNTDAAGSSSWQSFVTSTKQVQNDTGLNFFSALPNNLAWMLRSKVDGQSPAAPGTPAFAPASGMVGDSVTITGANLDSTTNVAFNGASASYTILSPTSLTAIVPSGATTGQIRVKTLGGTVLSATSFTVGAGTPDLSVISTHTSNFTQGDNGNTYTIVVTNVGTGDSSGIVAVTNVLPAGLTATAISGTGWTTSLGTLSATRSDALAGGAVYPVITVTVNVALNAPTSVTNTVTVSGGGDANLANNTNRDIMTINPADIPTATTVAASGVNSGAAILNGTVNPNGQSTVVQFQYGTTTNYDSTVAVAGTFTGTNTLPATTNISGLTSATLYHYRVVASNILGVAVGNDMTFTTLTNLGGYTGTLVGWDVSTLSGGSGNFGLSPLSPTTNAPNLTVGGLTRGIGVGTSGTGASRAWGGNSFTNVSAAAAVSGNQYATFSLTADSGYSVSFSSMSRFDYRRSGTGASNGVLQVQIGSGVFVDVAGLSYPSNTSAGGSIGSIDLSGVAELQNVGAGTNVTFRIVNWGGTSSVGTWYVFDVVSNTAPDFVVQGTVTPVSNETNAPTALQPLTAVYDANGVSLTFSNAAPGATYYLQSSSNLTSWAGIITNVAGGSLLQFNDPQATNLSRRFYRVVK